MKTTKSLLEILLDHPASNGEEFCHPADYRGTAGEVNTIKRTTDGLYRINGLSRKPDGTLLIEGWSSADAGEPEQIEIHIKKV